MSRDAAFGFGGSIKNTLYTYHIYSTRTRLDADANTLNTVGALAHIIMTPILN